MRLKPKLTEAEFNEVPEDLQENYRRIETEGRDPHYALEVEGLTDGLKKALDRERQNARDANAEKVNLAQKLTELERKLADVPDVGDVEALNAQHKKLTKTLLRMAHRQSIAEALKEHKAFTGLGAMFLDDKVQTEIVDGEVRAFVEHGDQKMTVSEYTAELAAACEDKNHPLYHEELARQFKPRSNASGAGTPPSAGVVDRRATTKPETRPRSTMTTKDKVAFIKQFGEDAFMRLKA